MKFNYDYVKKYFENEGYTLITDEYINIKQKLEVICPNNHTYTTSFKNFKYGRRCPICRKVSFEQIIECANNNGYKVLSAKDDFVNTSSLITVECENGHVSKKRYDNLGQGCKECQDNEKRNNYNSIKQFVENEGYVLLDNTYVNNTTPLSMLCSNGHRVDITFSNFKNGNRCKECCHNRYRKSYDEVKEIVESKGYKLLSGTYKNITEKLYLKCPNGHDYYTNLATFKWGNSDCPICNISNNSKGELRVSNILNDCKLEYFTQYRFKDCKDKRELPFDFYIPSLNLAIEFDGEQHFKPKSKFGGEESFVITIIHDAIKNSYCEDNNIKLIRIPYWEFENIENILTQHIILE